MQLNKHEFQTDLRNHIPAMVNSDLVINDGQLSNFLEFFASKQTRYTQEDCNQWLQSNEQRKAIRLIFVYYTLALSFKDDETFGASLEIFPLDLIGPNELELVLALTDHLIQHPSGGQAFHLHESQINITDRLEKLKLVLKTTFSKTL